MRTNKGVHTLLTLLSVFAACWFLAGCDSKPQAPAAVGAAPEVVVVTIKPQPVTLTTELSGRTSAYLVAEVRPQVDGIILKRLFTEGGDVNMNVPLYKIDPDIYQARLNSASASLQRAEANVVTEELRAERYRKMLVTKSVGQQTYDDAVAALKQARADVAMAKAELENAEIQFERTNVLAPISGRIGKSSVTPGALVTANQAMPLAVVQQLDPIYVDVTQSSVDMMKLRRELAAGRLERANPDQASVRLILEDGTIYGHEGQLQFSDVTVNQSTGSVTLRAIFPNPDLDLLPGMYVRTIVETGKKPEALLVPQQALVRDANGNATVMVVKEDNSVENRPVNAPRAIGSTWLLESGLNPEERVIVEGRQRVRFMRGAPAPVVTPIEKDSPVAQQKQEGKTKAAEGSGNSQAKEKNAENGNGLLSQSASGRERSGKAN